MLGPRMRRLQVIVIHSLCIKITQIRSTRLREFLTQFHQAGLYPLPYTMSWDSISKNWSERFSARERTKY